MGKLEIGSRECVAISTHVAFYNKNDGWVLNLDLFGYQTVKV